MVDKKYCMSSYIALRFIADNDKDFYEGLYHTNIRLVSPTERIKVSSAEDIEKAVKMQLEPLQGKKMGILLSGGMDSAILASYMSGCDAYTFRFLGGEFQKEELERAEYYARYYNLTLHYVDIDWDTVEQYVDVVMKVKAAPVHSIEPQIYKAALQAKEDGIEMMVTGAISDLTFGGMDQLLSKDWSYEGFVNRYSYMNPEDVLVEAQSMHEVFEPYRVDENGIDFIRFLSEVATIECSSSYMNAFAAADMPYIDPYAKLVMAEKMDLNRIRNGESKYLIRELMKKRYPDIPVPNKLPMPRPVDSYFENWEGPKRPEFKNNLDMSKFTGNQKWQLWCLERFLNLYEKEFKENK